MSNHLAVAAVTRTLMQTLNRELIRDVPPAKVVTQRPDAEFGANADPETRLFLYRVEPSAAWTTSELPTRTHDNKLIDRPRIALALNYLLTFMGSDVDVLPQQMLGSMVRAIHAHPVLNRADILDMVKTEVNANGPLGASDLGEQAETIRLSLLPLTLEELSNVWSTFFQAPYQLSVAFSASVVILTADETPTRALPVRRRQIYVSTIASPRIARVDVPGQVDAPIHPGTLIAIQGSQLRGDSETVVRIGGSTVSPDAASIGANAIEVTVPAEVRAGIAGVVVEHRRPIGDPPVPRLAAQSNTSAILIHPQIATDPATNRPAISVANPQQDPETLLYAGSIEAVVEPKAGARQHVTVRLNQHGANPGDPVHSYVFEDERRDRDGDPATTAELAIPFQGVAGGTYLVSIAVDGAESTLIVDAVVGSPTEGQYIGPLVTVP